MNYSTHCKNERFYQFGKNRRDTGSFLVGKNNS